MEEEDDDPYAPDCCDWRFEHELSTEVLDASLFFPVYARVLTGREEIGDIMVMFQLVYCS